MQATDIMVHFQEALSMDQKDEIELQLREIEGVIAPRFNKEHLLLVYYNSAKTNSSTLLNFINSKGYQTQLVGM